MTEKLFNPEKGQMRLAVFMSGSGSNARKLIEAYISDRDLGVSHFKPVVLFTDNPDSNAERIVKDYSKSGVKLSFVCNDIRQFYGRTGAELSDKSVRGQYDIEQVKRLDDLGVDVVALAGYDWTVTSVLCDSFLTVNVHPGDLRVSTNGKRDYIGLGWVPSAKSVLAGEQYVHSSVHVVTSELDAGPLLAVSAGVPVNMDLEDRALLLGDAESLSQVRRVVKEGKLSEEELAEKFPVYGIAKSLQEQLKVNGDWVIFPRVIRDLASGMFSYVKNKVYYDGRPIPNGLLVEGKK